MVAFKYGCCQLILGYLINFELVYKSIGLIKIILHKNSSYNLLIYRWKVHINQLEMSKIENFIFS